MWQVYAIVANQRIHEQQAAAERSRRARSARRQPVNAPERHRLLGRLRITHRSAHD